MRLFAPTEMRDRRPSTWRTFDPWELGDRSWVDLYVFAPSGPALSYDGINWDRVL